MQFTQRDVEILQFINEFGFCEITHIEKRFGMKRPRCYQVMQRLVEAQLVVHERVFHGQHGIFYLTKLGADSTDLPPIKNIPKDNYAHQLTVTEVYIRLREKHPEAMWLGERRIKHEKFMEGIGKNNYHLPDGIFVFPDVSQIAIEVELTMKSKKRLDDILWDYVLNKDIKEVWYYCSLDIIERIAKRAENMKRILVMPLVF